MAAPTQTHPLLALVASFGTTKGNGLVGSSIMMVAELYGNFHGLAIVKDLGLIEVTCESDCLEAVLLLQNKEHQAYYPHANILVAIIQLLD